MDDTNLATTQEARAVLKATCVQVKHATPCIRPLLLLHIARQRGWKAHLQTLYKDGLEDVVNARPSRQLVGGHVLVLTINRLSERCNKSQILATLAKRTTAKVPPSDSTKNRLAKSPCF
jgi:hypothetical protein